MPPVSDGSRRLRHPPQLHRRHSPRPHAATPPPPPPLATAVAAISTAAVAAASAAATTITINPMPPSLAPTLPADSPPPPSPPPQPRPPTRQAQVWRRLQAACAAYAAHRAAQCAAGAHSPGGTAAVASLAGAQSVADAARGGRVSGGCTSDRRRCGEFPLTLGWADAQAGGEQGAAGADAEPQPARSHAVVRHAAAGAQLARRSDAAPCAAGVLRAASRRRAVAPLSARGVARLAARRMCWPSRSRPWRGCFAAAWGGAHGCAACALRGVRKARP